MNPDKVHAIIVNWNGGEANLECLASLEAAGVAPDRWVWIDNASSDGLAARIAERWPAARVIENSTNLGYGDGCNQGIERALADGAEGVFLVNNDVTVPTDLVRGLCARLESRPELGVVGPRVLYAADPERVWAAGGMLTWRQNLSTLRGHRKADGPEYQRDVDVDYVAGCAMLIRREVFGRTGLLDGTYFAYHEDLDFCLQVRKAGYLVECAGSLACLHDAHHSTGGGYNPRRKYMMGVNTVWFLRSHGGWAQWLQFGLFDVLPLPVLALGGVPNGRWRGALAKAWGTWRGLRGRRVRAADLEPGASWLW